MDFLIARVEMQPDATLPELSVMLEEERGVTVHPGQLSKVLCKAGFSCKKTLLAAEQERGAWVLYLPKYSPGLNPIELAFSKLKAHLRKAAARPYDDLWKAIGSICNLFRPNECWNDFKAMN